MRAVLKSKKTFSESERGDELHRFALDIERIAALHEEGAAFFSGAPDDRRERRAYEMATIRSWARD